MYGNKSITLILYVHNLKILPPKLILKMKHLKFAIEENLISILNYDALFQLRTFQIFWGKNTPKKIINTEIRGVILVIY